MTYQRKKEKGQRKHTIIYRSYRPSNENTGTKAAKGKKKLQTIYQNKNKRNRNGGGGGGKSKQNETEDLKGKQNAIETLAQSSG